MCWNPQASQPYVIAQRPVWHPLSNVRRFNRNPTSTRPCLCVSLMSSVSVLLFVLSWHAIDRCFSEVKKSRINLLRSDWKSAIFRHFRGWILCYTRLRGNGTNPWSICCRCVFWGHNPSKFLNLQMGNHKLQYIVVCWLTDTTSSTASQHTKHAGRDVAECRHRDTVVLFLSAVIYWQSVLMYAMFCCQLWLQGVCQHHCDQVPDGRRCTYSHLWPKGWGRTDNAVS